MAGQLDAAPAAIEQPHAEGVLEIGNRLGDHRLRDRKISSRAPHCAGVCDRHENAEVAQFEARTDAVAPQHWSYPFGYDNIQ